MSDYGRREPRRLNDALQLNHSLATAYYLKEDLRQIWNQRNRHQAERFHTDCCARARGSWIRILRTMAKSLQEHRNGILNWYRCLISIVPLEGTINSIRTLKRQAYGFRDMEYFALKPYALHPVRFELSS